jgi:hypothetical protein
VILLAPNNAAFAQAYQGPIIEGTTCQGLDREGELFDGTWDYVIDEVMDCVSQNTIPPYSGGQKHFISQCGLLFPDDSFVDESKTVLSAPNRCQVRF